MKTTGPMRSGSWASPRTCSARPTTQAAKGRTFGGSDIIPIIYSRDFTLDGVDQN